MTAPMSVAEAIAATRGRLHSVASVAAWAAEAPKAAAALRGKSLVYFNGAFSPPTCAHAHIAASVCKDPEVDAVWLDPEPARPGKERWQNETLEARIHMCELLARDSSLCGRAGVGSLRKDLGPELGTSVELFRVLRALLGGPGQGHLTWAVGADVFEGMKHWADKAHACLQPGQSCDALLLFTRVGWTPERLMAAAKAVGHTPCHVSVIPMPQHLLSVSSHQARHALAQEFATPEPLWGALKMMPRNIAEFCLARDDVLRIYAQQVARL
ncbi:unnamed protein product [Effrenium voratum]|uniref:Uncharacterized protein n=1 Tax=Effrenium voratum TaxID=2562239 RepID=A0AA36IZE4_9DINO|nr:unnamed protein product [Effrenium voratum]CAJ1396797.1 unnamed protein product [Effrenium voratum]CAJ1413816.1 unnamed protein product [Effrenium voratum]